MKKTNTKNLTESFIPLTDNVCCENPTLLARLLETITVGEASDLPFDNLPKVAEIEFFDKFIRDMEIARSYQKSGQFHLLYDIDFETGYLWDICGAKF